MEEQQILAQLKQVRSPETKVEIYLQACREIQYQQPLKALEYAKQAGKIAKKAGLLALEIHAQRMQGICYYAANEFETALDLFQKTLPKYKKRKDVSGLARAYQNVGMALRGLGRNEEALSAYRESESLLQRTKEDNILAAVLTNIGSIWSVLGRPKEALEAYSECLAIADKLDDERWRARIMGNIAEIYIGIGDLETGIDWSKRSLELHRKNDDKMGVGLTLSNLGRVYQRLSDLDTALAMLSESLTVMSTLHDAHARARTMIVLAGVLLSKRRNAEARVMASEALDVFKSTHDVERTISCLILLGESAIADKDLRSARAFLSKANTLAAETDNFRLHVDIQRNLANCLAIEGKLPASLKLYRSAIDLAQRHNMHSVAAELHAAVSSLLSDKGRWKDAIVHERSAREQQRAADNELRAQHSQALQMRLDIERAVRDRERMRSEREKLELELASKERELGTNALLIAQKNELLTLLTDDLKKAAKSASDEQAAALRSVISRIDTHRRTGEDWKNLSEQLKDVQDSFLKALASRYPNLGPTEVKVASLLKLNLSSKEISEILNLSLGTVEQYRHRLRKKLGVTGDSGLSTFLQALDS